MSTDPFSYADGDPIQRDQWGRPIILRPWEPGGPCPEVKYCKVTTGHGHYTRASTFAHVLDDGIGLATWRTRHVALAVARAAPAGRAVIAGMIHSSPDLDEWISTTLEQAKRDEESLNAADWGTAVHRFTEPDSPPHAPDRFASDVAAYEAELERLEIEVIDTEVFIVNDDLRVAGTVDHLYYMRKPSGGPTPDQPGMIYSVMVVGDKKTGKLHPLAHSVQVACYAGGSRYDPLTGERTITGVHPGYGYVVHIPLGQGRCSFIPVDMAKAKRMAELAYAVQQARRSMASLFLS